MNRRGFLKGLGAATVALAAAPLLHLPAAPASRFVHPPGGTLMRRALIRCCTVYQGRLFYVFEDEPSTLYYSKLQDPDIWDVPESEWMS